MKTLIIAPYYTEDLRNDLRFLNFNQKIYSSFYLYDALYTNLLKRGEVDEIEKTKLLLYLGEQYTDREYSKFDTHFGVVPKSFHFDHIVVYDLDKISTQEAALLSQDPTIAERIYTTADATDIVTNIMEAAKFVK